MANLLESESCVSVEDIRDSLSGDILNLTDSEIQELIIRAEARVDSYLSSVGSEYSCNECIDCEDLPIKIKQAIVLDVQFLFDNPPSTGPVEPKVLSRSVTECGSTLSETFCDTCAEDSNPCDELSCDIINLLKCFEVNSLSFSLCRTASCGEHECCEDRCINKGCRKCLMNPF